MTLLANRQQEQLEISQQNMSRAQAAESAVLGLILLNGKRIIDVLPFISADDFMLIRNAEIFGIMSSFHEQNKTPDVIAVETGLRLKHPGKDGDDFVNYMLSLLGYAVGDDIEQHAHLIQDMAYRRRLAGIIPELSGIANSPDVVGAATLSGIAEALVASAASGMKDENDPALISASVDEHWNEVDSTAGQDGTSGLSVGYPSVDAITNGLQRGSSNVLAARPGMGKSALAFCIALNVAMQIVQEGSPEHVYLWIGEMTKREATMRMLSIVGGIDTTRVSKGLRIGGMNEKYEYPRYTKAAGIVGKLPIYFDDKADMTVGEMERRITKISRRFPLRLIIIDYLQLLDPDQSGNKRRGGGNENTDLTAISRAIKTKIARKFCPVVLLSQLNRDLEKRNDKRPQLSDLRASGAIEQDADTVTFIYRDDYYNPNNALKKGRAEIILAKNRHGSTGTAELAWEAQFTRFGEIKGGGTK